MKHHIPFGPAEILLPTKPTEAWPVVACDQYTSEPEYWETVEKLSGGCPSAYHLVLPELYLKEEGVEKRIEKINREMKACLDDGILQTYSDAMILVERRLADGRTRWGIVGAAELADYDYVPGTHALIRATEGTVTERIPPRIAIRKDAPLELPHVMLLIDDPNGTVIEPLKSGKTAPIYDLELMQNGGHIRGYLLSSAQQASILEALTALCGGQEDPMPFAVGDGNHSLATAKACAALDPENPLAQRALVEVVNIHDPALDFEPIYRVLLGVDPSDVIRAAEGFFPDASGKEVTVLAGEERRAFYASGLVSEAVQAFVDRYLASHPEAEVDYIHGEDVVKTLSAQENAVGFLFPGISKSELFPYVREHGALPRKTFSMGEAHDKRYYLEARKIKP